MKRFYSVVATLILLQLSNQLKAQVVINELSNTNRNTIYCLGETYDWIEFYNAGTAGENLNNYKLEDDNGNVWQFPSYYLDAKKFVVIMASGNNVTKGGFMQTNFKIAAKDKKLKLYKNNVIADIATRTYDLQTDHSFGRTTDGGSTWGYFANPTPKTSNNVSTSYAGYEPAPVFSLSGGMYGGAQTLTLSTTSSTGQIRYTTNGDMPKTNNALYSSAITINKTTVVAARVFSTGNLLPSEIKTNTYMIGENINIPVFTITIDSLELWDYNYGIYAKGPNAAAAFPYHGANFHQDWERVCHVEYYDKNHVKRFETNAGLQIFGGQSRGFDQKSLKLKIRKHYGLSEVKYALVPDKPHVNEYKNILLRNGGTDFQSVHLRDAIMHRIVQNENMDIMGYAPAVVYLNGKFWGFYEMRERLDKYWIKENYNGVDEDNIDFLNHEGQLWVQGGSDTGFYSMYGKIVYSNHSSSTFPTLVRSMLDVENFYDYFITETYFGNKDWIGTHTNNIKVWRPRTPGAKWRYMLWDLDWGLGLFHSPWSDYLLAARFPEDTNHHSEIFQATLENTELRNYFVNRYADLMNTIFLPSNVRSTADAMKAEIEHVMPKHFDKWGNTMTGWNNEYNDMLTFADKRLAIARNQVMWNFNLEKQVNTTLKSLPENAGLIKINTITPETLPWSGVYYDGVPITLTAVPKAGYKFSHWTFKDGSTSNEISITKNIEQDEIITANYEEGEGGAVSVHPNPVDDATFIEYALKNGSAVNIVLYNILGERVADIANYQHQEPGNYSNLIHLNAFNISPGVYFLEVKSGDIDRRIKVIKR